MWGVSTTNLTGFTAAVSGGYTVTGEDHASEADKVELKDRNGKITSIYYYNGRKTLSLKCYPSGGSASATSLPTIGEKVAVAAWVLPAEKTEGDLCGVFFVGTEVLVAFQLRLIDPRPLIAFRVWSDRVRNNECANG